MYRRLQDGIGFLASATVFGVVNYLHFSRPVTCDDCFFPYGLPFTFFREGGFAGGGGLVWEGIALNLNVVVLVAVGLILSWTLRTLAKKYLS